jgi:hypothetical protein
VYPSWATPACNFQALPLDPLLSIAVKDFICILDLTVELLKNTARKKSASETQTSMEELYYKQSLDSCVRGTIYHVQHAVW